jgi:hypothetical protein
MLIGSGEVLSTSLVGLVHAELPTEFGGAVLEPKGRRETLATIDVRSVMDDWTVPPESPLAVLTRAGVKLEVLHGCVHAVIHGLSGHEHTALLEHLFESGESATARLWVSELLRRSQSFIDTSLLDDGLFSYGCPQLVTRGAVRAWVEGGGVSAEFCPDGESTDEGVAKWATLRVREALGTDRLVVYHVRPGTTIRVDDTTNEYRDWFASSAAFTHVPGDERAFRYDDDAAPSGFFVLSDLEGAASDGLAALRRYLGRRVECAKLLPAPIRSADEVFRVDKETATFSPSTVRIIVASGMDLSLTTGCTRLTELCQSAPGLVGILLTCATGPVASYLGNLLPTLSDSVQFILVDWTVYAGHDIDDSRVLPATILAHSAAQAPPRVATPQAFARLHDASDRAASFVFQCFDFDD